MIGLALMAAGYGAQYLGGRQNRQAQASARRDLEHGYANYTRRSSAEDDALQKKIDAISADRQGYLSTLTGSQASPNRLAAGQAESDLAGVQGQAAVDASRSAVPWHGNLWSNQGGGSAGALQNSLDTRNAGNLSKAMAYSQATRRGQGVERYDTAATNQYGTQLVGADRSLQESQNDAALRQAKLDQIWQTQLLPRYERSLGRSAGAGSNMMMAGGLLGAAGGYANGVEANQGAVGVGGQPATGYNVNAYQSPYWQQNDPTRPMQSNSLLYQR